MMQPEADHIAQSMQAKAGRVLVVDDDQDFAESIRDVLEADGYEARAVYSREAALAAASDFGTDIALIDVKLGHSSGVDLICPLREMCPDVQTVMMTGYAAMDTLVQALRLEAVDYLHKPVEPDVLFATVERCAHIVRLKREKRAAMVALQKSEQKYRRLVESLRDEYFFYSCDQAQAVTYVSPSVQHVLGYAADDFGSLWAHTTDSPINAAARETHDLILRGEQQPPYDLVVKHADGGLRQLRVVESPVVDDEGAVVAIDGMAHDLTERLESQERFRRLANATQEAIVIHDGTLICEANEVFFDLFGHDKSSIGSQDISALWAQESRECYEEHRRLSYSQPSATPSGEAFELVAQRTDGKKFPAAVRLQVIPQRGRSVQVTAVRDLTAQRRAEQKHQEMQEQLRQIQKMEAIGQLTGGIAHDFNNMLQGIRGYAELIARRVRDQRYGSIGEFVEQICIASSRAQELISQLLLYSRGGTAESKPMKIVPTVEQAIKILRTTFPTQIDLTTSFEEVSAIRMDPVQLQQVVMNLCINARDAAPHANARIDVRVREGEVEGVCASCGRRFDGRVVEVVVADNGPGIEPAVLPKIFDPFFTTKAVGKGSGMGLAFAHGVVHEHSGHIRVTSEAERGCAFHLFFPALADAVAAECASDPGSEETSRRVGRGTILVIDDEPIVTDFLRELLTDAGYAVCTSNDPVEALSRFESKPRLWDLVITDQMMPGLTGERLARSMLKRRPELPIVLCTAYGEHMDEQRAASLNIRGFLHKPFGAEKTLALLRSLLDEPARMHL